MLCFRRDDSPVQYRRDLRELLLGPGVRFHIQHLVLALLGRLPAPTEDEAEVVREFLRHPDKRRARHALHATRGSPAWFRVLRAPLAAMVEGNEPLDRQQALWWLIPLVEEDADAVAGFLRSAADTGEDWWNSLAWFVSWCQGYTGSEAFVGQVVQLIQRGSFDSPRVPRDLWSSLAYSPGKSAWAGVAAIAAAMLRRVATISGSARAAHGAEKVLNALANKDPGRFVEQFLPVLMDTAAASPEAELSSGMATDALAIVVGQPGDEHPHSALLEALVSAAATAVAKGDPAGDHALALLRTGSTWTPNVVTARIYAEVGAARADEAVDWLLSDPRRFELKHWMRGALSETLIRTVGAHCSPDALLRLERALVCYSPAWELRDENAAYRGQSRWRLLLALPAERLSGSTASEVSDLKQRFGSGKEHQFERPMTFAVRSPIPEEESEALTDDGWQAVIRRYCDDDGGWAEDASPLGGAREVAMQLQRRAAEQPERFAALALRFPTDVNPGYALAVVGGLRHAALPVQVLERVVLWAQAVQDQSVARGVLDLVKANASLAWSEDVLRMVSWYAMDFPGVDDDFAAGSRPLGDRVWTQGFNSVRGAAAGCLGVLVEADASRLPLLLPAIWAVVSDPAAPVRACAADACLGVLRHDHELALNLAQRLVDLGGVALAAPPVERMLWCLGHRHGERLVTMLTTLLESDVPEVAIVGARQVTLLGLNHATALPLAERCLRGEPPLRQGASAILAANVEKTAKRKFCEEALVRLFDDEDLEVRRKAAGVFRKREGGVGEVLHLARAFVNSRAFADGVDSLLGRLEAPTSNDAEIIVLAAERFLEVNGDDAGNLQTRAALTAHLLRPLIMRAYGQADAGTELRRRCLDVVDRMYLHGVRDMEEAVQLLRAPPASHPAAHRRA